MLLYILYIRYCYNGEFAALAFAWSVRLPDVCVSLVLSPLVCRYGAQEVAGVVGTRKQGSSTRSNIILFVSTIYY